MKQENFFAYQDTLNHLKKEKILPVYLFWGKEDFLKEDILNRFKEKILDNLSEELNYKIFYADQITASVLINEMELLPFFTKHKLVVLKEAEKINQEEEEKIINYLNTHNFNCGFSTLIIIFRDQKKDEKPSPGLLSVVQKIGKVVKFEPPNRDKIDQWINKKFMKNKKRIDPEALDYLFFLTGLDLRTISNELEKLDLYSAGKKLIKKEDVLAIIGGSEIIDIFKFLDCLGEKRLKDSLNGIIAINNSNLFYLSIFAMIYRQFRLILQIKMFILNKINNKLIKKELKLPEFVIEKLKIQAKLYQISELVNIYKLLNKAEIELKNSQKNPQIILEELVINIIHQK